MPDLPTFAVTDVVEARVFDAFADARDGDGNVIPPARAYKQWLRTALVNYVQQIEAARASTLEDDLVL